MVGFSFGCIEGYFMGGRSISLPFCLLNNSTLADWVVALFISVILPPSFLFTLIPFCARASLYILKSSSSLSSLSESDWSSFYSKKISLQRGSFPTYNYFSGLNRVFLGIFFFPFFLRRRMMRARFFETFSMIPSSLFMKFDQSYSEIAPPTSSLLEW